MSWRGLIPILKWEGFAACLSAVVIGGPFGPIAAIGVGILVLALLISWRRRDYDRSDYFKTWWRLWLACRWYSLVAWDDQYRPLPKKKLGGLSPALVRKPQRPSFRYKRNLSENMGIDLGLQPSPLSEQVPLWDIVQDQQGGVLVTPNGQLVVGYELKALHTAYSNEPVILHACEKLYQGAARLPDHWEAQFFLYSETEEETRISYFEKMRSEGATLHREQARERAQYLKAKRPRFFRVRVYISRRYQRSVGMFQSTQSQKDLKGAIEAAESFFRSAGVDARRLNPDEIYQNYIDHLNPGDREAPVPILSETDSLRSALVRAPVTWTPDDVRLGKNHVKVLTLTKLPSHTVFTDIETLFLSGLPFDFLLVTHVQTPSRSRVRAETQAASRIAYATAEGSLIPSEVARQRFSDIREGVEQDESGRQRMMLFGMQIAVWGSSLEEVQNHANAIRDVAFRRNYTVVEESGRHDRQYLLSMAPGGLSHFDRWIRVLSNNVVDMLPVFSSRGGDRVPACIFETDRGELWSFDPAAAHRANWNNFVVGSSGSGKSVFVNSLIANACLACEATKGRVLVIDFAGPDKSSYLMLAEIFGGRFIPIASEATIGLNPFPPRQEVIKADGDFCSHTGNFLTVLTDLLVENQERGKDTKLYRNLIQEGIRELYYSSLEPCYESFLLILKKAEERGPDQRRATLLRLLHGTLMSPGGRLFLSKERLQIDEGFVIFDVFGIESYAREIREAIVFLVCETVRRLAFDDLAGSERKKYIFLDEVAQLVRQPGVVELIQELYATARKHGTAVTTVTQKYTDFVQSGLAASIRSNSTTGVFLSHTSDAASRQLVARDMDFNGRETHLFSSLHVKKGEYSEILLRTDDGPEGITTAKLRLGLPSFEYELYTSDVHDRIRQKNIQKKFPNASKLEVLRRAARR